jgi:phosphatidylinositol alpha-mannosyltransferase
VKVALVSPYDLGRFGGVQDQAMNLASWLNADGHEAWVIGPGDGPEDTVSVGPATQIPVNLSTAPISINPAIRARLREAVVGADVVHVHEPLAPTLALAAVALPDVPLVGTFHADPSPAVRRFYRASAPLLRRVLGRLDVVTAVSPVAAGAVDRVVTPRLVPNGVDVASHEPDAGNPRQVAFVGRDDPRKGLDVLLAAWPIVRAAVPDAELAVAAGDRIEDVDGVRFVGALSNDAKRKLLTTSAVFCAPNLGGESFGIVLVEGMASGCAVVASALPGFTYVLGDAGVLVKPGDPEGLARSLIHLLENDAHRAGLQRRGLERAWRFDRAEVLAGYLAAYREAVGSS